MTQSVQTVPAVRAVPAQRSRVVRVHAEVSLERDVRSGARRWQAVVAEPSSSLDGLWAYGHTFGSARDALLGQLVASLPGAAPGRGVALVLDACAQAVAASSDSCDQRSELR
jgi:hypothetical protein